MEHKGQCGVNVGARLGMGEPGRMDFQIKSEVIGGFGIKKDVLGLVSRDVLDIRDPFEIG